MNETITFKKVGFEWAVYADGTRIGTTRANGSRLRERSWDYRGPNGTKGKASSRKNAAEAVVRTIAETQSAPSATITREGDGRHRAGRVYHLQVNGKYAGTYETRQQAIAAARDAGAVI